MKKFGLALAVLALFSFEVHLQAESVVHPDKPSHECLICQHPTLEPAVTTASFPIQWFVDRSLRFHDEISHHKTGADRPDSRSPPSA